MYLGSSVLLLCAKHLRFVEQWAKFVGRLAAKPLLPWATCGLMLCVGCHDTVPSRITSPEVSQAQPHVRPQFGPNQWHDLGTTSEENHKVKAEPKRELPWIDWIATHCHVDEIGFSAYSKAWMQWVYEEHHQFHHIFPPGAPRPKFRSWIFPKPGSDEAKQRAAELREAWAASPTSHIIDCRYNFEPRDCPGCEVWVEGRKGITHASFIAYIPEALIREPERVRAFLLLIPGGGGGRARFFLSPIPNKSVMDSNYGGLETKLHLDALLASNPEYTPPLVVALDHAGWTTANGPIEFVTHDVSRQLADVFLDGVEFDDIALGAEGISAGARAVMLSTVAKPNMFNVIGLNSLHCGNAGSGGGISAKTFGKDETERRAMLGALVRRHRDGLLHVNFVGGGGDNAWPCIKNVHQMFVDAGMFPSVDAPILSDCRKHRSRPPGPGLCHASWPGFELFRDVGHDYVLLERSWRDELDWQLKTLSHVDRTLRWGNVGAMPLSLQHSTNNAEPEDPRESPRR